MKKRKQKTDAEWAAEFEANEKKRQKQYARAIKEAKKDPEYMDHGFMLGGGLVIWKRPAEDPRVAALMSPRLRPDAITFGNVLQALCQRGQI
jgi:hypothetical protein